ncbi:MAG: helicase-associated domain-containing protein [Anaerolineales bacterium]|nr:helicase-associated domain-containing protein [Anaerolineales bacterium]
MKEVLGALNDPERVAMALFKRAQGSVVRGTLQLYLVAMGLAPSDRLRNTPETTEIDVAESLLKMGLIFHPSPYYAAMFRPTEYYLEAMSLVCDRRVLEVVDPAIRDLPALPVTPSRHDDVVVHRSAPAVMLDILGYLRAIEDLGGIGLTKSGAPRVNDMRKLQRAMQWTAADLVIDGLHFWDALNGVLSALAAAGWLAERGDRLVPALPLQKIASLSYAEVVTIVCGGFLATTMWREPIQHNLIDHYGGYHTMGRNLLAFAIQTLPAAGDGYFSLDEFDAAFYARIGDYFSVERPPQPPYLLGRKNDELTKTVAEWRNRTRAQWLGVTRVWIEKVLTGWFYFLGMVEIGLRDDKAVCFRLTPLGHAVLNPGRPDETVRSEALVRGADDSADSAPAWVVQPNFDVVVYLDRVTATQLAFLERSAGRTSAQQHVAHYQLTRDSVYRGLESGLAINDLLGDLQRGAHAELPQNVVFEIREWAALRERITVHRRSGRFLEFASAAERSTAAASGLKGEPLGDRFWLVRTGDVLNIPNESLAPLDPAKITRISYIGVLPSSLSVTEDGIVTIRRDQRDLLIEAQISQWADRISDTEWRLTAERVSSAIKSGSRLSELTSLLKMRLSHALPPLLDVVLRNWADRRTPVEVGEVVVLRCMNLDVMNIIKKSAQFRPLIRGELGPDTLLVDATQLGELQKLVKWAGMENQ